MINNFGSYVVLPGSAIHTSLKSLLVGDFFGAGNSSAAASGDNSTSSSTGGVFGVADEGLAFASDVVGDEQANGDPSIVFQDAVSVGTAAATAMHSYSRGSTGTSATKNAADKHAYTSPKGSAVPGALAQVHPEAELAKNATKAIGLAVTSSASSFFVRQLTDGVDIMKIYATDVIAMQAEYTNKTDANLTLVVNSSASADTALVPSVLQNKTLVLEQREYEESGSATLASIVVKTKNHERENSHSAGATIEPVHDRSVEFFSDFTETETPITVCQLGEPCGAFLEADTSLVSLLSDPYKKIANGHEVARNVINLFNYNQSTFVTHDNFTFYDTESLPGFTVATSLELKICDARHELGLNDLLDQYGLRYLNPGKIPPDARIAELLAMNGSNATSTLNSSELGTSTLQYQTDLALHDAFRNASTSEETILDHLTFPPLPLLDTTSIQPVGVLRELYLADDDVTYRKYDEAGRQSVLDQNSRLPETYFWTDVVQNRLGVPLKQRANFGVIGHADVNKLFSLCWIVENTVMENDEIVAPAGGATTSSDPYLLSLIDSVNSTLNRDTTSSLIAASSSSGTTMNTSSANGSANASSTSTSSDVVSLSSTSTTGARTLAPLPDGYYRNSKGEVVQGVYVDESSIAPLLFPDTEAAQTAARAATSPVELADLFDVDLEAALTAAAGASAQETIVANLSNTSNSSNLSSSRRLVLLDATTTTSTTTPIRQKVHFSHRTVLELGKVRFQGPRSDLGVFQCTMGKACEVRLRGAMSKPHRLGIYKKQLGDKHLKPLVHCSALSTKNLVVQVPIKEIVSPLGNVTTSINSNATGNGSNVSENSTSATVPVAPTSTSLRGTSTTPTMPDYASDSLTSLLNINTSTSASTATLLEDKARLLSGPFVNFFATEIAYEIPASVFADYSVFEPSDSFVYEVCYGPHVLVNELVVNGPFPLIAAVNLRESTIVPVNSLITSQGNTLAEVMRQQQEASPTSSTDSDSSTSSSSSTSPVHTSATSTISSLYPLTMKKRSSSSTGSVDSVVRVYGGPISIGPTLQQLSSPFGPPLLQHLLAFPNPVSDYDSQTGRSQTSFDGGLTALREETRELVAQRGDFYPVQSGRGDDRVDLSRQLVASSALERYARVNAINAAYAANASRALPNEETLRNIDLSNPRLTQYKPQVFVGEVVCLSRTECLQFTALKEMLAGDTAGTFAYKCVAVDESGTAMNSSTTSNSSSSNNSTTATSSICPVQISGRFPAGLQTSSELGIGLVLAGESDTDPTSSSSTMQSDTDPSTSTIGTSSSSTMQREPETSTSCGNFTAPLTAGPRGLSFNLTVTSNAVDVELALCWRTAPTAQPIRIGSLLLMSSASASAVVGAEGGSGAVGVGASMTQGGGGY
ncbi:unnamed protein product [Amoebophrya sp. A25]|nr:unnamed protein product [Amoebophrya sp. A25]|eukprot:GSA25T00016918001.1